MLHPYSIFFKAMWETPPAVHDDEAVPERTRRMRWRLWWSYAARRRAAAERAAAGTAATTQMPTSPTKAARGGIAG